MIPTTSILRQSTLLRGAGLRALPSSTLLRPALTSQIVRSDALAVAGRRWNTEDARGGKSKLIFRVGLKDIPVELYPMMFVVAAAVVGAGIAVGRHFYYDGLRLKPSQYDEQK